MKIEKTTLFDAAGSDHQSMKHMIDERHTVFFDSIASDAAAKGKFLKMIQAAGFG